MMTAQQTCACPASPTSFCAKRDVVLDPGFVAHEGQGHCSRDGRQISSGPKQPSRGVVTRAAALPSPNRPCVLQLVQSGSCCQAEREKYSINPLVEIYHRPRCAVGFSWTALECEPNVLSHLVVRICVCDNNLQRQLTCPTTLPHRQHGFHLARHCL